MSKFALARGDCLEAMREMKQESVDAIVTDPPYNEVNDRGGVLSGFDGGLRRMDRGASDSLPVDVAATAAEFVRVASGWVYVWCGWEQLSGWVTAFRSHGLTTRVGVWRKTNASPLNGDKNWLSAIELCAIARKPNAWFGGHCAAPVWTGPYDTSPNRWHPTPKPAWLMREQVVASAPEGGTVLDPFMGSGTTGVACRLTGRHFIGVDLNREYVERARIRIARADARQLDLGTDRATIAAPASADLLEACKVAKRAADADAKILPGSAYYRLIASAIADSSTTGPEQTGRDEP